MDCPAKIVEGKLVLKPFIEIKEDGSRIAHVPSLKVITKFLEEKHGEWNL